MRGRHSDMTVKRAIALLILITISSILFITISTEKNETLKLENAVFSTYRFKEYSMLGVRLSKSFPQFQLGAVTKGKLDMVGVLRTRAAQYAVVSSGNEIRLHAATGKQVEAYSTQSDREHIISCCVGDINKDSKDEILVVTGTGDTFYGNKLVILSYDQGLKKLYERSYKEFNPWKVQIADVDGDDIMEVSIGVYKESPFHPVMAKRPFVFNWYKGDLVPKWRGSRLSRPFEDYIFSDIDMDGMEELIAIEVLPDGEKCISAYKWRGFGFESMVESGTYEDIDQIRRLLDRENGIRVRVKKDNKTYWVKYIYNDMKLEEEGRTEK